MWQAKKTLPMAAPFKQNKDNRGGDSPHKNRLTHKNKDAGNLTFFPKIGELDLGENTQSRRRLPYHTTDQLTLTVFISLPLP